MYHDSYSPRQWLLNAAGHLDRSIDWDHAELDMFLATHQAFGILIHALSRLG